MKTKNPTDIKPGRALARRRLPYALLGGAMLAGALLPASAPLMAQSAMTPDYSAGIPEYSSPTAGGLLERARRMIESGNYTGAIDQLRSLRLDAAAMQSAEAEEIDFLMATALYETGDPGCAASLHDFIAHYPASARTPQAQLMLADDAFFSHRFTDAARLYAAADISGLDASTRRIYAFRRGVSETKSGYFDRATAIFKRLEENPGWRDRARFFLAYIDYLQSDYDAAYEGFQSLEGLGGERVSSDGFTMRRSRNSSLSHSSRNGASRFADYVPTGFEAGYYMAQIEYLQGKYAAAAERARRVMTDEPVPQLLPEMNRIAGESLFKLGRPDEAMPYITAYTDDCRRNDLPPQPTAVYTLGAILYGRGDYEQCLRLMSSIADVESAVGQGASLYAGKCYARLGDTDAAAMAFDRAYRMDFDSRATESALYGYAAARTRGGRIPFSSSVPLLEEYLRRFPDASNTADVREYLATAYYNEKDYAKAWQSISRIKNPDARMLAARQKVAYEYGAETLAAGDAAKAAEYLRVAADMTRQDAAIARQARFWLADALYAQGKYSQAQTEYNAFLAGEPRSADRTLAIYDLAYSLYMQRRYADAAHRFAEAISARPALPSELNTDAALRRADCLYYSGSTDEAIRSYSAAISAGATGSDYALLRRALAHGTSGDARAKIADLTRLLKDYPDSKWAARAMLETGLAYLDADDLSGAVSALERLTDRFPSSPESRQAWLNIAIARSRQGDTDKAVDASKQLIRRWPASEEAALAGDDLRNIYASQHRLGELAAWLESVPGAPRLDNDEVERLTFDAAARALGSDAADTGALERYVADYPAGKYLGQALYELADVYSERGDYDKALAAADRLLAQCKGSRQTAPALLIKAQVLENHSSDADARRKALDAYRLLEQTGGTDYRADAFAGIMRTSDDASTRLQYARRLETTGGLTADQADDAALYKALALIELKRPAEAEPALYALAENPERLAGARAAVALGENLLKRGKLAEAEKVLTTFTDAGSPHQYELARGFIALADVYYARGRKSLAREYLLSLKSNYPGAEPDIARMIATRLARK